MTTDDIVTYYVNLLILQYRSKPGARGSVDAVVRPTIMDQLPNQVQAAFAVDTAVGVQLDVVGKYAGVTRMAVSSSGTITLDDDDFRTLIKLAIARNTAGSSLNDIQNLIHENFAGKMFVYDHLGMRMSFAVNSSLGSLQLMQIFLAEGLFPKPMAVQLSSLIYYPTLDTFFSFRTYSAPAPNGSPFNTYSSYANNTPWLSYAFVVSI